MMPAHTLGRIVLASFMAALCNLFADIHVRPKAFCIACALRDQLADVQRLRSLMTS